MSEEQRGDVEALRAKVRANMADYQARKAAQVVVAPAVPATPPTPPPQPDTLEVWGSQQYLYLTWQCADRGRWRQILDSFKDYFPTDRTYHVDTRSWSLHRRHRRSLEDWAALHFPPAHQDWDSSARKRPLLPKRPL